MLGERIRQARLEKGLSQDAIAKALTEAGYPANKDLISQFENDKAIPNETILHEISQILAVDSAYLLDEKMPSLSELLAMPLDEREKWIQRSFSLAANEDFEIFEAFDEEDA
jgi:transcriptional regulator with XRE-family HTH domain